MTISLHICKYPKKDEVFRTPYGGGGDDDGSGGGANDDIEITRRESLCTVEAVEVVLEVVEVVLEVVEVCLEDFVKYSVPVIESSKKFYTCKLDQP
ncbi:hypothetical protein ACLOJK_027407 [Asimina triloba]